MEQRGEPGPLDRAVLPPPTTAVPGVGAGRVAVALDEEEGPDWLRVRPRGRGGGADGSAGGSGRDGEGVVCEECSGTGWLLCDFCKGKKNNVKSESSRIYRRCPTCKAAGYILCPRCRVYKCITFPDSNDS